MKSDITTTTTTRRRPHASTLFPTSTLAVCAALVVFAFSPINAHAQVHRIATLSTDGDQTNNTSYYSILTPDGRFICFQSQASNLVDGDTNGEQDIFVHDLLYGTTERVNVSSDGEQTNRHTGEPAMTANGRFIAFTTDSNNLVDDDTNGTWDVFVHDRRDKTTVRVSLDENGNQASRRSDSPEFTPDGRYIFFHSEAALVSEDTNFAWDIYRLDRQTGDLIRVSTTSTGEQANGASYWAKTSADGTRIAFMSSATNLVESDTNGQSDVFVKDLNDGQVYRVNISNSGQQANSESTWQDISDDGRVVTFNSLANNLVTGDSGWDWDAFAHFVDSAETIRISVRPDGGEPDQYTRSTLSPSADGRFIAFASLSTNLVEGDTNGEQDIFIRDLGLESTVRISMALDGSQCNDDCFQPNLSPDARYITFTSDATNLDVDDTNFERDIFGSDLHAGLRFLSDPLARGRAADFTVLGLEPNERAGVLYSLTATGDGPCPPELGGLCLDLLLPINIAGTARGDSNGEAIITINVPNGAPLVDAYLQAAARRGSGGSESVKSHSLARTIQP